MDIYKINVKRIDKSLPMPSYQTDGSVGFDLCVREDVTVPPKDITLLPMNVIVEVPPGCMMLLALRSSTPRNYGLMMPHGIGVIDSDYCGPEDEIMLQVVNVRDEAVDIEKGTRLAQGIVFWVGRRDIVEVEDMTQETRGGFGSTGVS